MADGATKADFREILYKMNKLKHSGDKIPLGERLRQIREKIVASGKPLLDEEEIAKELARAPVKYK